MNREINFMNFENLNRLIEEHKKETHPYKRYEFDSTSYTLLLIDINNLVKENKALKENAENNDKVVDKANWENQLLKKENKQLKDNWNKLKEYVKETRIKEFEKAFGKRNAKTFKQAEIIAFNMVIDKIQELEKSDSNVKD